MRTTVTLDPDVAPLLEEAQHRSKRLFKQVRNDAVRAEQEAARGCRARC